MTAFLRPVQFKDNVELARIIRDVFEEFDAPKEGSVYSDDQTDHLFELFNDTPGSCYFVAEENGVLLGGCGVFPTEGLPNGYAELVKLYLSAATRGKGIGKILMEKCFEAATGLGYTHLYLESFPQFAKAVSMYEGMGCIRIDQPLGNSGHFACTIWLVKEL
ncbi:GNAT family N-acetyltransferase [Mucilaginibacter sp.]|uniref:GNAT family N-acetyltransferase n=1 Tax=Mucilaginibacter sp. TaxID=1882438 RepID=UPI0026283584|nr:GNAT family N-acetyltransferase [Mucilaginibacter sp.]MDB5031461.1 GCN5-related N-acetyltransferase [Mucilaginibacter sp.]